MKHAFRDQIDLSKDYVDILLGIISELFIINTNDHTNMTNKLYIQPIHQNFSEFLEHAQNEGYNLEIASFAFPDVLDNNWSSILEQYKKDLIGFTGTISMHGVFKDLYLNSGDKEVRNIAEKRILHNLEIASELNTKFIVFHTNFIPIITHESYRIQWVKSHARFWKRVIKEYDITIVLENMWDPDPSMLKRLVDRVQSPFLKICFDTGHWNIFSKVSLNEWFSVLKDDIVYVHVNDNKGEIDNELIPGQGTIDWGNFNDLIRINNMEPEIIIEVGSLEKTIQSIDYFKENAIYPFH